MWNMKFFHIPVITGATGIVTKELKKVTENKRGKHTIHSANNSHTGHIKHNKERAII
jgi:hypothetical protein